MAEHDSELYDDIYGEGGEGRDYSLATEDFSSSNENGSPTIENAIFQNEEGATSSGSQQHTLPAKPQSPSSTPQLSYSAQIAQQFSAYRQTPSQERQQRFDLPRARRTEAGGFSNVTQRGPSAPSSTVNRPIRPSEMKDEGKLFIGGLSWDTTDEGLRQYFSEFGKVDACTIMRDPDGRSRGFAFLTFEDATSLNTVFSREHFLDGKTIDPKRAIPREEHLRNTRYFLGGLSPNTTSESIRDFFSVYGKVVDTTVMVDRESGRSKGFGFVTFEDAGSTDQLVGKAGLILDDKQIEVRAAQPRSQRDSPRGSTQNIFPSDNHARQPVVPKSFPTQAMNTMPMLGQRMMGQGPMMMPGMAMNPLAMGMGMNGYPNFMNTGMQSAVMENMNSMNGVNPFGMGNPLRLGVGPMAPMGMPGFGMGNTMMVNSGNMHNMAANMLNSGLGPARLSSRGQHSFHPYARR